MIRCAEIVNETDNLQQGSTSTPPPTPMPGQASIRCNAPDKSSNKTGNQQLPDQNADKYTPCHPSSHSVLNSPPGSRRTNFHRLIDSYYSSGGRKCNLGYQHYHCTLCPLWRHFTSLYLINRHIQQTHVNPSRTIDYDGYRILPCKQKHATCQYCGSSRYHYHCPFHNKTVLHKSFFIKHMTVHTCKVNAVKPFPQATTNPKHISDEDLPKLAKTPDIVQKSKGWHWIPSSCAKSYTL